MLAEKNNVVLFDNDSVAFTLESFLITSSKGESKASINTVNSYRSAIKDFFRFVLNKDVSEVTWDDIKAINVTNGSHYKKHLESDRGLSINTINARFAALWSFWKYLSIKDPTIRENALKIGKLKQDDSRSWGALREDEADRLLDYCDKLSFKPQLQKLFFETVLITAIRSGALLNMKWSNVCFVEDSATGQEMPAISTLKDKGKVDTTPLPEWFYNRLLEMKQCQSDDDLVFDIDIRTLRATLSNFCKLEGIKESRNIRLHSLKKTSGDIVFNETGRDLVATARHLHHSNINTAYKRYILKNESLADRANLRAFKDEESNKIDMIEEICQGDYFKLMTAIESCGNYVMEQILKQLNRA